MYEMAEPLDIHCMKQQNLLRRYESEEEDVSESELGVQDHAYSPVDSQRDASTFESDLSADDLSNMDGESDRESVGYGHLLSPYPPTSKGSRPVSMDTVKRSSTATYVADSLIFDHDDDMIIELPSPNSTSPLQSPIFLQPSVYVPESPPTRPESLRSASPSSIYSDDESDVCVAEQVVYVEPIAKPSIVVISPSVPAEDQSDSKDHESSEEKYAQVHPLRQSIDSDVNSHASCDGSMDSQSEKDNASPSLGFSATISNLSEIPEVPHMLPPRSRSKSFSRPWTAFSEKARSRFPTDSLRRPPSMRNISTTSLPFWHSRSASPLSAEESHHRSASYSPSLYDSSDSLHMRMGSTSRTNSPAPYYSSQSFNRERSGSTTSIPTTSSPLRTHAIKHSATSSVYSTHFRPEPKNGRDSVDFHPMESTGKDKDSKRKSKRRSKQPKTESESSGKSFMGLWLGSKRRSTTKLYQG